MAVLDWLSVGALGLSAVFAFFATVRIRALNQVADERRLSHLASFFDALLVAFLADVVGAVLVMLQGPMGLREGFGLIDLLYWARHVGWFVALVFAFLAFVPLQRPRGSGSSAPVMAAWLLLAEPVLLVVEGLGLFVLVLRSAWNHLRKSNLGSLEVALGFALLAAGRFLPFLLASAGPPPLGAPHLAVSLTLAAGLGLLMMVVPGAPRGRRVRG